MVYTPDEEWLVKQYLARQTKLQGQQNVVHMTSKHKLLFWTVRLLSLRSVYIDILWTQAASMRNACLIVVQKERVLLVSYYSRPSSPTADCIISHSGCSEFGVSPNLSDVLSQLLDYHHLFYYIAFRITPLNVTKERPSDYLHTVLTSPPPLPLEAKKVSTNNQLWE